MGNEFIERTSRPHTRASLAADITALGVRPGALVLLHSSMSRLGYIVGGVVALLQAWRDALSDEGTLVVPTYSSENSDPSRWIAPPVPADWWPVIREHTPVFDRALTPSWRLGIVPETLRSWPGVLRSDHPQSSFAAWGPLAHAITDEHAFDFPMGDGSPLARIYDHDGSICLLGVGHGNNSSLHLSEFRAATSEVKQGAAVLQNGQRTWRAMRDVHEDDSVFPQIGAEFDAEFGLQPGRIGDAEARLLRQRDVVDFGLRWLQARQ
jgi:aminoglycoside 3-N-acetyltransferase